MRKIITLLSLFVCLSISLLAQERTITGRVVDDKGVAIEAVSIISSSNKNGTQSSANGNYSITIPAGDKSLIFSSVNYDTKVIKLKAESVINVTLVSKNSQLEDVIVTGYTVKKKNEFTGASSKVNAKQIEQVPIASFEQILQGRAPGLYIASGSGQPGTAAGRVNIRGVSSISGGSGPLYILDGIPIEEGVFRSINPNDFESVDVLKDAASAGLYGSRGANGVIVLTSKKGKVGKTLLQYRGQVGNSIAPKPLNLTLMNTEQRLRYEADFLGPAGVLGVGTSTGFPGWDYSPNNPAYVASTPAQQSVFNAQLDSVKQINTDWADIFFRKGTFRQHELNASGGTQNLTFFTSLSVYQQEGVIIRSNLDRYTFRGNLDFKTERLTASIRSTAGYSISKGIESESAVALANPVAAAYLELPYRKLNKAPNVIDTGAGRTGPNAFDRSNTTTATSGQFKGGLAITLQYNIWNGISFKTTNGVDYRNNNQSRFIDPNQFAGLQLVNNGRAGLYNESFVENVQLISTSGLVYNKNIKGMHVINVLAMSESIRNKARTFTATGYGINVNLPNTPAGITPGSTTNNFIPLIGGNRFINGLSSLFAAADYTYNKRYTISASLRRDVTSQVPEKNKSIILSTVGLTWNLMAENFMKNQNVVDEARVRMSTGESANLNGFVSEFGFIPSYGATNYSGVSGIFPNSPGNPEYRIESQVLTNIGFDVAVWNKRVRITADAYRKESKNLFVNQGLSRTTGFNTLSTNAGEMENRGIDAAINVDAVSNKNVLLTVGVNGGFLRNRITSLGQLSELPQGTGIIRKGYSFGSHFQAGYLGVNPQTGLAVYEDINGNPTTDYLAANNRAEFGTFLPKFTGGGSVDFSYKGFDFAILFSTAQGVYRFNNESFFYESTNGNFQFNKKVELLNSWRAPGDRTEFQKINSQRQFSSKDIDDASFVRLRNVQAGYTYSFKKIKSIRSIKIWAQAQNLYTWTSWTGFDPEESNNIANYEFPNPKTYTVGLDINF